MEAQNHEYDPPKNELFEFTLSSFITYTYSVNTSLSPWQQAQVLRYELLLLLREVTSIYGISNCSNEIRIWNPGHPTHEEFYRKPCNNRHACPVCTAIYMARKREELCKLMKAQRAREGEICTQVLTQAIPNDLDTETRYVNLLKAWTEMCKSAAFRKLKQKYEVEGYCRILEETVSSRGWFPHFHCVWLFGSKISEIQMNIFGTEVAQLWSKFSNKVGALGTLAANQRIETVDDGSEKSQAKYLFKHGFFDLEFDPMSVSLEKTELRPFELLTALFAQGDGEMFNLWQNFEKAVSGKSRISTNHKSKSTA